MFLAQAEALCFWRRLKPATPSYSLNNKVILVITVRHEVYTSDCGICKVQNADPPISERRQGAGIQSFYQLIIHISHIKPFLVLT